MNEYNPEKPEGRPFIYLAKSIGSAAIAGLAAAATYKSIEYGVPIIEHANLTGIAATIAATGLSVAEWELFNQARTLNS